MSRSRFVRFVLVVVAVCAFPGAASAQLRAGAFTTVVIENTTANALLVGCTVANPTPPCTGGIKAGTAAITSLGIGPGATPTNLGIHIPSTSAPSSGTMVLWNNSGALTWNNTTLAAGGSISGTLNRIAVFVASDALGDSIMEQSGDEIDVTGYVDASLGLKLGGANINTPGTLTGVAYQNQSNAFVGDQTFSSHLSLLNNASELRFGATSDTVFQRMDERQVRLGPAAIGVTLRWNVNGRLAVYDFANSAYGAVETGSLYGDLFAVNGASTSSAGRVRLNNADAIGWRNNAGSGNVTLSVGTDDVLAASGGVKWGGGAAVTSSNDLTKNANNLSDLATPATARTNLGATTVGSNIFTLTNPSAVRFLRVNADNTVSALSADDFRAAISAGTMELLRGAVGTASPSGSSQDADTVEISGLTDRDSLYMIATVGSTTSNTASVCLYNSTDAVTLACSSANAALHRIDNTTHFQTGLGVSSMYEHWNPASAVVTSEHSATTFTFTGTWDLALRLGAVVGPDPTNWSWAVYKLKGQ